MDLADKAYPNFSQVKSLPQELVANSAETMAISDFSVINCSVMVNAGLQRWRNPAKKN